MPVYEFECQDCTLRFRRTLKMGDHTSHPCPRCGTDAPRLWEGFGGHQFAHGGTAPANSGVHDHDYPTADKAVGRDAELRWGEIHEREKVKEAVRKLGGTSKLSRQNGQGYVEYTAMSDAHMNRRLSVYKEVKEALVRGDAIIKQ
jgi:putative FmdB family regulatory protein